MQEDIESLHQMAESPEVQDYLEEKGDAVAYVQESEKGSFLYVQSVDDGKPERAVLAYLEDGEMYSPEEISDDPEFTEELGTWLMGHGDVVLDESILEKRPRFV
mgnify:FL=1